MRHATYFILLLLVVLVLPACTSPQSVTPSKPDPVVLEIITHASGVVYPKQGDLLDMRLYESGRFEYDDYPDQPPPDTLPSQVTVTKKEAKLNPEDVKELIGLAEQPDFLSAKDNYPGLHPHTDDEWITTIKFMYQGREKKIVVVNLWDIRDFPNDRSKYPPSMVKLFERALELKAKAIRKS
ncbi:MAG: hypothetical protein QOC96_2686 [Acidobacteriota bacterium]|jgi:hypothetical protein|nr:hypothetical protein [Acidobacteriota bacterium]